MSPDNTTELVIAGAGAAGLMAACYAGEYGMAATVLERKHRAGSKLLMCGNGRCNLTSDLCAKNMLLAFGGENSSFLTPAITAFGPAALQKWFRRNNLPLMRTADGKIFPASERASDVVHCLTDKLRDTAVSLCFNSAVEHIEKHEKGRFSVYTKNFAINTRNILIATGGVSYPKTGSVGDGQKIAIELGHHITPYRPGLVGIVWKSKWQANHRGERFSECRVTIFDEYRHIAEERGLVECENWGLGGGAILNATRIMAGKKIKKPVFEIYIKATGEKIRIENVKTRPLKEAMVTVGGVALQEVDNRTMESRKIPGIYFAGEILDIDGPTGGFNLTAAFATARLAVANIAEKAGLCRIEKPGISSAKSYAGKKKNGAKRTAGRFGKKERGKRKSYTERKRQHWSKIK